MTTASVPVCFLTTVGRRSGQPHRIEIWFVVHEGDVYLLSGNGPGSDWVRNLRAYPQALLELPGQQPVMCAGAVVEDGDDSVLLVRQRMDARYHGWTSGSPLSHWASTSTVVRLRVPPGQPPASAT